LPKKYSKAIATSKQSYEYLLFEFAGFSPTFSDMAQNIMSAAIRGGWVGVGVGWRGWMVSSGYPSDTTGPVVVPKEPSTVSKPHYKAMQAVR